MRAEAVSQYRGAPLDGPVSLKIGLYWPTHRDRDVDNIKGLLDSFTGVLYRDDGQIYDMQVTKRYCKENPRVEVEMTPLVLSDHEII